MALEMRLQPETTSRLRDTLKDSSPIPLPRAAAAAAEAAAEAEGSASAPPPPPSTPASKSSPASSSGRALALADSQGSVRWLQGATVEHPLTPSPSKGAKGTRDRGSTTSASQQLQQQQEEEADDPLDFLTRGFRELVSCRLFLQGCYVYAFYTFATVGRRSHMLEASKQQFEEVTLMLTLTLTLTTPQHPLFFDPHTASTGAR